METFIICATVLVALVMVLYVTHGLVVKYLHMREDTYKDMEVLFSNQIKDLEYDLKEMDSLVVKAYNTIESISPEITKIQDLEHYYNKLILKVELNETYSSKVSELILAVDKINDRIKDYEAIKGDFEEIQSKASSLQMGKAFIPRRRS